jgi:hypothetical protein
MYYVVDLRQDPPHKVEEAQFQTIEECCEWIDENGDVSIYTIEEE